MTQTYQALGFDPAPGVPQTVKNLVDMLSRVSKGMHEAHQTLTKVGKQEGAWQGEAASGFSRKLGELPKHLDDAYSSLSDAAGALHQWESRLSDFESTARRYEAEAQEVRKRLREAEANPDLQLAGKTFDTESALQNAESRLHAATRAVTGASDELEDIVGKAKSLLEQHNQAAQVATSAVQAAAHRAPEEPGLFSRFLETLKSVGDEVAKLAEDVYQWAKDNADLLYKIGDWLGYASAACDVLAIVFSETIVGAVVFEAIGIVLNAGALAFHGTGWALGSEKGSWLDIGLDVAGFIPFGDFARLGKVGAGALKGVDIPLNLAESGAKAADAMKRADDIVAAAGGTAHKVVEEGAKSVKITADSLSDRFSVAVARHFGDENLYKAAGGLVQKVVPKVIENTPLKNIPQIVDSVKPIVDDAGETVGKYVDPRSWAARGTDALMSSKQLVKEGVRLVEQPTQYYSERIYEKVDRAGQAIEDVYPRAGQTIEDVKNQFG